MPPHEQEIPSLETLLDWMEEGPRKKELEGETEFCAPKVLADVLNSKVGVLRLKWCFTKPRLHHLNVT